jgi:hypothetical protein
MEKWSDVAGVGILARVLASCGTFSPSCIEGCESMVLEGTKELGPGVAGVCIRQKMHEEYHPKSGSTVEAECSMEILVQLETKRPNREDILWNIAKMAIYRVEQSDAKMEKAIC